VSTETVAFHGALDDLHKPSGVKVFQIAGWNRPTITWLHEALVVGMAIEWNDLSPQGDGTVPLVSAETVDADAVYYADLGLFALWADHNTMLTKSEIQKQVVGLLTSGAGIYGISIATNRPTFFNAFSTFTTFSPVRLSVFDSAGNQTGFLTDGTWVSQIPGSSVDFVAHSQSVSVPGGSNYTVVIQGLDTGTFTLWQTDSGSSGQLQRRLAWDGVPVVQGSLDTMLAAFGATNVVLNVDTNGTGVADFVLPPGPPHDLAVTSIKAPKKVKLVRGVPQTKLVTVQVVNLGPKTETIPNTAALSSLVMLSVQSLGTNCPSLAGVVVPAKKYPVVLAPKKKLTVRFQVTFNCANDALPTIKTAAHNDFRYVVTLHHEVLDGEVDMAPFNDTCPRDPSGNDLGCGNRRPNRILGADVVTDVVVR
jgi:hypothetical protein